MLNPRITSECVRTLRQQIPHQIPISIKIRLGVDNLYSYSYLSDYVGMAVQAGASIIFVHARKALLKINPKENRGSLCERTSVLPFIQSSSVAGWSG